MEQYFIGGVVSNTVDLAEDTASSIDRAYSREAYLFAAAAGAVVGMLYSTHPIIPTAGEQRVLAAVSLFWLAATVAAVTLSAGNKRKKATRFFRCAVIMVVAAVVGAVLPVGDQIWRMDWSELGALATVLLQAVILGTMHFTNGRLVKPALRASLVYAATAMSLVGLSLTLAH